MMKLKIEGMNCQHCEAHVKDALERVPGITLVEVDLASGKARVEGKAAPAELLNAVNNEGYRAQIEN